MHPVKSIIKIIKSHGVRKGLYPFFVHAENKIFDKWYCNHSIVPNRILFASYPDYSDNSRVLYEYMVQKGLDKKYELIWCISERKEYNELRKKGIKCVFLTDIFPLHRMHRFYYYARTAKIYFITHSFMIEPQHKPRNGQLYIDLEHGGMGFKRNKYIGGDASIASIANYRLTLGRSKAIEKYQRIFWNCTDKELLPFGMVRNDLLYKYREIPFIDAYFGKKILWSPTFRQSDAEAFADPTLTSETSFPIIYTKKDIIRLNEYLKSRDVHLFITTHPYQKEGVRPIITESNIHSVPSNVELGHNGIQFYEIINHFDAMISDYSSITFDYLYLNRPVGYTLDDFEAYSESRGFAFEQPLDYMPGHHIYTYDDFIQFINDIAEDKDPYKDIREDLIKKLELAEGGGCCQRILDYFKL